MEGTEEVGIDEDDLAEMKRLEKECSRQYGIGFLHGTLFIGIIAAVMIFVFKV